mmetsp:Transcript_11008/g.33982  ORF Transcript_11008/g.33982 Transcript_11008/m.33982 type:complete len:207 (-) Transcript_11008:192-812(-)|eukprot:scaffold136127_cov22-Tisochrysis_lutea.AAC.2
MPKVLSTLNKVEAQLFSCGLTPHERGRPDGVVTGSARQKSPSRSARMPRRKLHEGSARKALIPGQVSASLRQTSHAAPLSQSTSLSQIGGAPGGGWGGAVGGGGGAGGDPGVGGADGEGGGKGGCGENGGLGGGEGLVTWQSDSSYTSRVEPKMKSQLSRLADVPHLSATRGVVHRSPGLRPARLSEVQLGGNSRSWGQTVVGTRQ